MHYNTRQNLPERIPVGSPRGRPGWIPLHREPGHQLFELIFISGRIVPIAGEAVDLPADHEGPVAVGRILQHLLELGPVISGAGQMPIGVDLHDPEAVLLRKKFAVSHLLLNGTVPLGMGRVTCIVHRVLNIRVGYRIKFLFHGFPQLVR